MGRTMELNVNQVISLVAAALGGGGLSYALKALIRRDGRSANTDYWYTEFTRLTNRIGKLEESVSKLEQDLQGAQQEALFWRGQFYDEALSHKTTRHTFSSRLLELKEQERVTPSDIERIYLETVGSEANRQV